MSPKPLDRTSYTALSFLVYMSLFPPRSLGLLYPFIQVTMLSFTVCWVEMNARDSSLVLDDIKMNTRYRDL